MMLTADTIANNFRLPPSSQGNLNQVWVRNFTSWKPNFLKHASFDLF